MYKLSDMSKDERSLLLFFETCWVDYGGLVDVRHMNESDMNIAKKWSEEGFLYFGRVLSKLINNHNTHFVIIPDDTVRMAHEERMNRAIRIFVKRDKVQKSWKHHQKDKYDDFWKNRTD
jgi:hypothetical protein